ncbi:hypothetical protein AWC38_SpisGene19330 [Stylophora pistillata]|uniref:Uncharacterized protein n=1 Tax=Stylophora pistillata TaxID=50429 RepID=A0A2B4RJ63_STYPI|nr:hypothetical protein AWC38_SpisGene19330 [Stylophora pistillata]
MEMAEEGRKRDHEEAEDGEKANKSQKAIRLLREVTTLLTESVNDGEAKESREELHRVRQSSNANLDDFRNIFSPYKISPAVLTSTFQQPNHRSSKQKQRGVFFQPKETWKHDELFCLALKGQTRAPLRAEKLELQATGLGRRKVCFHSKAKSSESLEKLEEEFPKLMSGDGFVLMRTGHQGNSCLSTISPPATVNSEIQDFQLKFQDLTEDLKSLQGLVVLKNQHLAEEELDLRIQMHLSIHSSKHTSVPWATCICAQGMGNLNLCWLGKRQKEESAMKSKTFTLITKEYKIIITGFVPVLESLESPGIFLGLESPGNLLTKLKQ